MDIPTKEIYGIDEDKKVLLIGTAKKQDWAISVDININSPCNVLADGCNLPFLSSSFDVVILDFVTNFLPKEHMIDKLIKEANRVGKRVVGRCMVTPGKRLTIKGAMVRYTHRNYPFGVDWIGRNA
jgi:ubiquinone/menaquinone biosynthesis C-methylase UbiE